MKTKKELEKAVSNYKAGNQESFEKLYILSYPYLYTCVSHIIKDNNIIMDMLQETYLEISRSIFQLKESKDFLKWAAVIANRKCLAYLKKNNKIVLTAEDDTEKEIFETIADDEAFIPEELFQNREKRRLIREIIDELNEVQRLCVIGYYYNEQKQEEIAQELGIPVNTVKSHLNRAKEKIKNAVLNLQEKKGTKLYCFTPFMLLYFAKEAGECKVTGASERLLLDLQGGIFGVGNKDETKREKTGSNRIKFMIPVIISALFTVMILACGSEEAYESPDRLEELLMEEEAVKQEPAKETFMEETAKEEPAKETAEPEHAKNNTDLKDMDTQPDWVLAYRSFLQNKENFRPLLSQAGENAYAGYITGFFLHDINHDEIPELFLQKSYTADFIYTYTGTEVELRDVYYYDSLLAGCFLYDSRDDQPYYFMRDGGTGVGRVTSLIQLELPKDPVDMSAETIYRNHKWIYSASFGSLEQDAGAYIEVPWEEAIPEADNKITQDEFMGIIENSIAFSYQTVSDENITSFVSADYREIWDKPSLKEYEEKEPHRYDEFLSSLENLEVSEPIIYDEDEKENVVSDPYNGMYYFDLDSLTCYRVKKENIIFQEDWKQIYWQWLNSDEWLEECENQYGDRPENMVFWFEEWEGVKTPILCMYNELYASTVVNCYMISSGEVKWFGWFGRAAMGYMEMFLINGGEYYFACNATVYCDGTLYRIVDGEVETVWNIFWNDSEFSGEDEADYLIDTPKCTFMGNDMSKEESMAQVDALLGEGAAEQLRNRILLSYGMEAQENGPLLLQDMEIAWENIYHYDQLQDMIMEAVIE